MVVMRNGRAQRLTPSHLVNKTQSALFLCVPICFNFGAIDAIDAIGAVRTVRWDRTLRGRATFTQCGIPIAVHAINDGSDA
jgi:hypothetical protein